MIPLLVCEAQVLSDNVIKNCHIPLITRRDFTKTTLGKLPRHGVTCVKVNIAAVGLWVKKYCTCFDDDGQTIFLRIVFKCVSFNCMCETLTAYTFAIEKKTVLTLYHNNL